MSSQRFLAPILAVAATLAAPSLAQKAYTSQDYAQAERWMSYNVNGLVQHTISRPEYLPDGRVFYRDPSSDGTMYMIADPAKATTAPAFDNAKLAAALSTASGKKVEAKRLGVSSYQPEQGGGFAVGTRTGTFHCDISASKCTAEKSASPEAAQGRRRTSDTNVSPDGKLGAFIRDYNLWVRDVATGKERQLTTDGVKDFGYSTDNAGWQHSSDAILTWSADSSKIATFQMDERKTGMMYLVPVTNRHPQLEAWHYPLVGDKDVTMIEPVIIDVASAKVLRLKTPPLEHRSMECDDVSCNGDGHWTDVEFSPDNSHLAIVATSRDHKDEYLKIADTASGEIRDVYHEHVPTYYGWQAKTDWKYLPASDEFLWVSERSNYAQIYLYDLKTGKLKNQITQGDGPVSDILNVDEKHRVIYFTAVGKEKGEDLYFDNYYRVGFDGTKQQLLTPEAANHVITPADDGSTFVDIYSTIDKPQTAV